MTPQTRPTALPIALMVLSSVLGVTLVLGQGGTGRENTNSAKPAPKRTNTPREPPAKSRTPSFRPRNPGIELVRISPGSFMMGSASGQPFERPVHNVTINYSFYLGKYEVTQGQWRAVMGTTVRQQRNKGNPTWPIAGEGDNYPMYYVSWEEARTFAQRLNALNDGYTYRLPTEAEWEYACRAGTTGDYAGELKEMAWLASGDRTTHAVGQKQPNAWGLYDMYGNVAEWCEDWAHPNYNGAPTDGSAWLSRGEEDRRMLRGGSYDYVQTSASRNDDAPNARVPFFGFRIAAVPRTSTNSSSTTPATVDADPVLFPKDTRNPQPGETKPKSSSEPVEEKVYAGKDVDQRAQILDKPKPFYTDSARTNQISGKVVLKAVLASSGQVTNIRVISGLPNGLTEQAIAAARKVKFTPAMKDGKAVSQEIQFEYNFSPY